MAATALTEEIATNLEEAAQITRQIDTRSLGFFLGGIGLGATVGFFFGYRFSREKIKAEAFKQSEEEIAKIREHYQQKTMAAKPKPSVGEVIEDRGYSSIETRLTRPPVPVGPPRPVVVHPSEKPVDDDWDYAAELAARTEEKPYIIHQDEFHNTETGYQQVTYTYWATDDVLADEDNSQLIIHEDDGIIVRENLRWGHGSTDINVVHVRNDALELEIEICRIDRSYGSEIMGLTEPEPESEPESEIEHSSYPRTRQRKKRRN